MSKQNLPLMQLTQLYLNWYTYTYIFISWCRNSSEITFLHIKMFPRPIYRNVHLKSKAPSLIKIHSSRSREFRSIYFSTYVLAERSGFFNFKKQIWVIWKFVNIPIKRNIEIIWNCYFSLFSSKLYISYNRKTSNRQNQNKVGRYGNIAESTNHSLVFHVMAWRRLVTWH